MIRAWLIGVIREVLADALVASVQKLEARPGDVVVFTCRGSLDPEMRENLRKAVGRHMPAGVRGIILDREMKIDAVLHRPELSVVQGTAP